MATGDTLSIVAARIYLDIGGTVTNIPLFRAGSLVAGQWEIRQEAQSVEDIARALIDDGGLLLDGIGRLKLASNAQQEVLIAPPVL